MSEIDKTHYMQYDHRKEPIEKRRKFSFCRQRFLITCKPNSRKSKTHINKYIMSEIAKTMKRHPVDTFRNVGREKVNKLAVLPQNPSKNVNA